MRARDRWLAAGVVGVHAVVSVGHGVAHGGASVGLTAFQQSFVAVVVGVAPLAALALLWRGRERAGSALLAGSMAAALAFGLAFHYLLENPDNVASVAGPWAGAFGATAALVALVELAGAAVGVWLWVRGRRARRPAGTAA